MFLWLSCAASSTGNDLWSALESYEEVGAKLKKIIIIIIIIMNFIEISSENLFTNLHTFHYNNKNNDNNNNNFS